MITISVAKTPIRPPETKLFPHKDPHETRNAAVARLPPSRRRGDGEEVRPWEMRPELSRPWRWRLET
jgi:hypothetical protein